MFHYHVLCGVEYMSLAVISTIQIFVFLFPYFLASARKHLMMPIRPRATRNRCQSRRITLTLLRTTIPTASLFLGAGSGESSSVHKAAVSPLSACSFSSPASDTCWSRTVARLRYLRCCPQLGPAIPRDRRQCEQIYGRYTRVIYAQSKKSTPRINDVFFGENG